MTIQRRLRIAAPILAALCAFVLMANPAVAQKTWVGGLSGSWNTASNWSPSGVPTSSDNVVISGGVSGVSITFSANGAANTLSITNQVTFTSNFTLTVSGLTYIGSPSTVGTLVLNYASNSSTTLLAASGGLNFMYTGSTITNGAAVNRDVAISIGSTITMVDVNCYIGNPNSGPTISSTVGNANALASDVRFEGDLTLGSAGLVLGTRNLYVGKYAQVIVPGTVGATDGFIQVAGNNTTAQGTVRRQFDAVGDQFTFPIGPAGGRMSPISLRIASASVGTFTGGSPWPHVSARVVLNQGGNGGHPENQQQQKVWVHWPLQPFGINCPVGLAGLMEFHNNYRSGSASDLYSARFTDNYEDVLGAGGWDLTGTVQVIGTSGDVRAVPFGPWFTPGAAVPCFGDFTVGQGTPGGDPVPVELVSFSARYVRDNVELNWQTATELNNYGFAIERSLDGESWEEVDFVPGAGNSYSPRFYNYTDLLEDGLRRVPQLAYRLRQVDRDGTTDFSSIVFVKTGAMPEGVELYAAYPNPFNPSTTLSFSLRETLPVTVKVFNMFGQEVVTLLDNASTDAGFHTVGFQGNSLPSGSYSVMLQAGSTVRHQRIVLNK